MYASNRPQAENGRPVDHHLTGDELNRYLDHDLSPVERGQAEAHLATCPECRATLSNMQVLASLLHELPEIRPPRSLQLGPEHARQPSFWGRLGAMLMPMLPAMRAATVALALLLGGVTAFRIIDEPPTSGPVSEQAAPQSADVTTTTTSVSLSAQMPAAQEPTTAPTSAEESAPGAAEPNEAPANKSSGADAASGAAAESGPAHTETSGSRSAGSTQMQLPGHPGPSSATDDSSAAASSGPADNTAMIAIEVASPTASPTAAASPTALPTATSTTTSVPVPTATPAPAPSVSGEDNSWLGWAQAALAALLAVLGVAVVGLTRVRNRLP
jgi:hypothetical protein